MSKATKQQTDFQALETRGVLSFDTWQRMVRQYAEILVGAATARFGFAERYRAGESAVDAARKLVKSAGRKQ